MPLRSLRHIIVTQLLRYGSAGNSFIFFTSLVDAKSTYVWVDHRQVERRKVNVRVGKSNEHGTVHSWITLEDLTSGLVGVSLVLAGDGKRSVGQVELRNPSDVSGFSSSSGS